jgi:hypothetical protein
MTPASAAGRDGGYSARAGSRIAWLFGDTFPDDQTLLCATAAWSDVAEPARLDEAVDARGRPLQLYEFSPDEHAFNAAHETYPTCCGRWPECPLEEPYCHCPPSTDCATRIAIWPGSVFPLDDRRTVSYYEKVWVGVAPYDFEHLGTGTARLETGRTVAIRTLDAHGEPDLVFGPEEPNFFRGLLVEESGIPTVYAYARTNRNGCVVDVLVAQVPLDRIQMRSAYRFWSGSGWSSEVEDARPVLSSVVAGLGTVAWNDYLRSYLAAEADLCTGGNRLLIRTAPRPEGPWSASIEVSLEGVGAKADSYAAILHPELDRGRRIALSVYQPELRGDEILGRVRLFRLTLARTAGARVRYPRTRPGP